MTFQPLRCYCNDEALCGTDDTCITQTVCMTKRQHYKNQPNTTVLKYYCGETAENSFRTQIIQFRDCLVHTQVYSDLVAVTKSPEHCCNDGNYCNKKLNPNVSAAIEFPAAAIGPSPIVNPKNPLPTPYAGYLITPLHIVLLVCLLAILLFIVIITIGILYINKRKKSGKFGEAQQKTAATQQLHQNLKIYQYGDSGSGGSGNGVGNNTSKSEVYPFLQPLVGFEPGLKSKPSLCFPIKKRFMFKKKLYKWPENEKGADVPVIAADTDLNRPYILGFGITNYVNSSINSTNASTDGRTTTTNFSSDVQSSLLNTTTTQGTDNNMLMSQNDYLSSMCYTGSGSGSGNPMCVQRTVARDIKLIDSIGKGRYGEVWKGKWFGEELVAVKTFNSTEEKSWENEVNVYLTQCLRDENILGFIAADNIDRGLYTELWIITDYHNKGSLFDYLNSGSPITPKQAFAMCFSMVKGIVHLHRSINGCRGKLALAHCDLKSKNILVKDNLTCCISDFGLALCGDAEGNVQQCNEIRTGTKRYMAPEIINRTIDYHKIDAYQKADMYSLALVFWEMLRRLRLDDSGLNTTQANTLAYEPPYFECVDLNPDEAQMRQVVCELKRRPGIPVQCEQTESKFIRELLRLIEELWADKADARLNALRVRKTLDKFNENFDASASEES